MGRSRQCVCGVVGVFALLAGLIPAAHPEQVQWVTSDGGEWTSTVNWSSHPLLPGPDDDVVIPGIWPLDPYVVTLSSGEHTINSLVLTEELRIAGGSLEILDGVVAHGLLRIDHDRWLQLHGGLRGTVSLHGGESSLRVSGTQTFDRGQLRSSTPTSFTDRRVELDAGTTLTLGEHFDVTARQVTFQAHGSEPGPRAIISQGTIAARLGEGRRPGPLIRIDDTIDSFINEGTMSVEGSGRRLEIAAANWSNLGTIIVDEGILDLGGSFTTADIGTIERTGGIVRISGDLDNTGATLSLADTFGPLTLLGGRITGGTLAVDVDEPITVDDAGLHGVHLQGDAAFPGLDTIGSTLTVSGGLESDGTITLDRRMDLQFQGTQTIDGARIRGGEFHPATLTLLDGAELTFGEDLVIESDRAIIHGTGQGALVNHGTIRLDEAVNASIIGPSVDNFTNHGLMQVSNGAEMRIDAEHWTNLGTIEATDAALRLGGHFTNDGTLSLTNSTVSLTGTLENTDRVFTIKPGNAGHLGGVRVIGGTVRALDEASLTASNATLDSTSLEGDLTISNTVTVTGGLPHSGTIAGGTVRAQGTQTFNGGTIASSLLIDGDTTLTLGDSQRLQGAGLTVEHSGEGPAENRRLINQGTIHANQPHNWGLRIESSIDHVLNQGVVQVTNDGYLRLRPQAWTNEGLLEVVHGRLDVDGQWSNTGTIRAHEDGRVFLRGDVTTAGLGTIERGGDHTIFLSLGLAIDNTGDVFTLDAATGDWNADGGRIEHGTVRLLDGATFAGLGSGIRHIGLHDVRLEGVLDMNAHRRTNITGGLELDGTIRMRGSRAWLGSPEDQTIDGGTIIFEGLGSIRRIEVSNSTLTLGPNLTVRGNRGQITRGVGSGQRLINQGQIRADVTDDTGLVIDNFVQFTNLGLLEASLGGRLSITGADWVNKGTINVVDATMNLGGDWVNDANITATDATLSLTGNWSNQGVINAIDATVDLGGSFSTDGLGEFNRTRGTVNVTGTLDNTDDTLRLSELGTWRLAGGTIQGGAVQLGGQTNALLRATADNNNHLIDATVHGNIFLDGAGERIRLDTVALNGAAVLTGARARLEFLGDQSFDEGIIVFEYEGTSQRPAIRSLLGGTLTLGQDAVVRGGNATIGIVDGFSTLAMQLINHGTIAADVENRTLVVAPRDGLINHGTLRATGGGHLDLRHLQGEVNALEITGRGSGASLDGQYILNENLTVPLDGHLALHGDWTAAATIHLTQATLELGGSFDAADLDMMQRDGGLITIAGTLDNTGRTLTASAAAPWQLAGGQIVGGSVHVSDNALAITASNDNQLTDVRVLGDLTLDDPEQRVRLDNVQLDGTVSLRGARARVEFVGEQTLHAGTIVLDGEAGTWRPGIRSRPGGRLTLGPDVLIRGGHGTVGIIDGISSEPMKLVNHGTIAADVADRGILVAPAGGLTNHGTLRADHSAHLDVRHLQGDANDFELHGEGSRITLHGDYVLNRDTTVPAGTHLTLRGVWSNEATIELDDALLELDGTFTPGTIAGDGGHVHLLGTLQNQGRTLTLAPSQPWELRGGRIVAGTLRLPDPAGLTVTSHNSNRLDGVRLEGTLELAEPNAHVRIGDGLELDGTVRLTGTNASLRSVSTQSIDGGTIAFEAGTPSMPRVIVTGGTVLTLGPAQVLRGGRGQITGTGSTAELLNAGRILADVGHATGIELAPSLARFTNAGLMHASHGSRIALRSGHWSNQGNMVAVDAAMELAGGTWTNHGNIIAAEAELTLAGTWHNVGSIIALDSTIELGGQFTTAGIGTLHRGGSSVSLVGTLDNRNTTLSLGEQGTWRMLGGTILGGHVHLGAAPDATLMLSNTANRLLDVSLAGELAIGSGQRVMVRNLALDGAIRLAGPNAHMQFLTSQSLAGGALIFEHDSSADRPGIAMNSPGTLTLGQNVLVRGGHGTIGSLDGRPSATMGLVNYGTIAVDTPSQRIDIDVPELGMTSHGRLEIAHGSSLAVTGDVSLGDDHVLRLSLVGGEPVGPLDVTGQLSLAGTLEIEPVGDAWHGTTELIAAGLIDGQFDDVMLADGVEGVGLALSYEEQRVLAHLALLGDMNHDGHMDTGDVAPFVLGLVDPVAYQSIYGLSPVVAGDINGDGLLNTGDISAFVSLLVGGTAGATSAVPEPTTLALLALGALALNRRPTAPQQFARRRVR